MNEGVVSGKYQVFQGINRSYFCSAESLPCPSISYALNKEIQLFSLRTFLYLIFLPKECRDRENWQNVQDKAWTEPGTLKELKDFSDPWHLIQAEKGFHLQFVTF